MELSDIPEKVFLFVVSIFLFSLIIIIFTFISLCFFIENELIYQIQNIAGAFFLSSAVLLVLMLLIMFLIIVVGTLIGKEAIIK